MKVVIKLPAGLELDFEGDEAAFEQFTSFLRELPAFVGTLGPPPSLDSPDDGDDPGDDRLESRNGESPLDPQVVGKRMDRVGAKSDIERVTVLAQAAVEAGLDGIDFPTASKIYDALAIRRPPKWKTTFGNARTRGYVQNAGIGLWKPTVPGMNFAKYGPKESVPAKKRQAPKKVALVAPQPLGGGETD